MVTAAAAPTQGSLVLFARAECSLQHLTPLSYPPTTGACETSELSLGSDGHHAPLHGVGWGLRDTSGGCALR